MSAAGLMEPWALFLRVRVILRKDPCGCLILPVTFLGAPATGTRDSPRSKHVSDRVVLR